MSDPFAELHVLITEDNSQARILAEIDKTHAEILSSPTEAQTGSMKVLISRLIQVATTHSQKIIAGREAAKVRRLLDTKQKQDQVT